MSRFKGAQNMNYTESQLKHYSELIDRISCEQLLKLPNVYKNALKDTTSLAQKIRILEFLIDNKIVR